MQILDLPKELFREIIESVVILSGVSGSLHLRLVCKTFGYEIQEALFSTRCILTFRDARFLAASSMWTWPLLSHALYTQLFGKNNHGCRIALFVRTTTSAIMAIHTSGEKEENSEERFTQAACACLVALGAGAILVHLDGSSRETFPCWDLEFEQNFEIKEHDCLEAECLTLAAYVGDTALFGDFCKIISSKYGDTSLRLDLHTRFGIPLWAATIQGHTEIMRYLLKSGKQHGVARCFENDGQPNHSRRPVPSPFVAATASALEGKKDALSLLLDPEYGYEAATWEMREAMVLASRANNVSVLSFLLAQWNEKSVDAEPLWSDYALDMALVESCSGGAHSTARVLLQAGADPDAAGGDNRTCLQHAARSGNLTLVRMLLNEDASMVPARVHYSPSSNEYILSSKCPNAIQEAKKRGFNHIVEVLEEIKVARGYKMSGLEYTLAPRVANNPSGRPMPHLAKKVEYLRPTKPRRYSIEIEM
ncbi:uncharacterized protein K452DRAFT_343135 [Aplosporella prunicola CBS 121167]|uniref:Uncharacterized protein n=1 Tax=Aplosporella prunicola CBS 121167 TaxID=1176127 RepID=A0A6A6AZS4_9PEZI|nr:uncharacterized protein K452DRAFT_343135 [Aplosporella prunicola CBS 121167]KAF2136514.1 hypothetical protein K452DRAFT_343135 [Aplosporella prunicola CBS 121167]